MKKTSNNFYPLRDFTIFFSKIEDIINNKEVLEKFKITELKESTDVLFDRDFRIPIYNGKTIKVLYVPISNPDICVFTSNLVDGANSYVHTLNDRIKGASMELSIHDPKDGYKFYCLCFFKGGEIARFVRSMQDPRWDFYAFGEPLWFENTDLYTQRLIKKRINVEVITNYLMKLGFDINNINFWKNLNTAYQLSI